jgi:hypothetical protein
MTVTDEINQRLNLTSQINIEKERSDSREGDKIEL